MPALVNGRRYEMGCRTIADDGVRWCILPYGHGGPEHEAQDGHRWPNEFGQSIAVVNTRPL